MCGICGQFNYLNDEPVDADVIGKMTAAMVHRGPDDSGTYLNGSLGLGFRRLSIIDLDGGHQPMSNQDETVWVVFNGEIYNFPDLKQELEHKGHVFRTNSDTEVIVHGYREWGRNVLDHLNGMFGLAVWDLTARRLMIARDPLGVKPLYYRDDSGCCTFSSEIRPLLACPGMERGIDPVALNLFLRFRYAPSPQTLFNGINKLAPGQRLLVEDGRLRIERWWKFAPIPFDPMPSIEEAEEELLHLYKQAVRRQLISDVPVGILLSGGLDSGLLLALMRQNGSSWKSFTIGFGKEFKNDEIEAAAHTARLLDVPNFAIEIERKTFEESLPAIITALEEPLAATSVVPMYHLCRRAREDVKVVLMGQGPDELFGGYTRHLGVRYGSYWRSIPACMRMPLKKVLSTLPRSATVKRALYSLDIPDRMQRYRQVLSLLPQNSVDGLFHAGLLPDDVEDSILECWGGLEPLMQATDELGGLQFLEIRSSLPDELLMYGDKLSMAHSLEARVPYLDKDIVQYAERLSSSFKIRGGSRKWLHRRVCRKYLPSEIVNRKKLGFHTPIDTWFRESISGKIDSTLLEHDSLLYRYLRPQAVQQLVEDHRSGKANNYKTLFSLVLLEEWMRHYLDVQTNVSATGKEKV